MGNLSPEQLEVTKPLDHNWRQVVDPLFPKTRNYVLLKNAVTGQQAQEYDINLIHDTLSDSLRKYQLRFRQKLHLVSVKSVQVLEGGGTCSGVKNKLRVVTEKIDHNLSSHPKLGYQEGMQVLLKALIGFKAIYQFEGYLQVHSNLIFFNSTGDIKVWMNECLALNQPERRFLRGDSFGSQKEMINDIVLTIEYHLSNPR